MTDADLYNKLDRARLWAMDAAPFYASLTLRLADMLADGDGVAGTDGKAIVWRRDWLAGAPDREVRFVLLHETMHAAHGHLWRLPLTPRANVAEDHVINLTLLSSGLDVAMPTGGLADPQYSDMSEEEVYALLPETEGYSDACGGLSEPDTDTGTDTAADTAAVWQQALEQAALMARARKGDVPAMSQRLISEARVRRVDWRAEMAAFIASTCETRPDYRRGARRHAAATCIMPRRYSKDTLRRVVFVRDTSGSIDEATLGLFNAAISAACADVGCTAIIIDADCAVHATYVCAPGDDIPATAQGGGGTSFIPAFDAAEDLEDIAGIVYLTDLEGVFPSQPPAAPVLWVATTGHCAPFGQIVRI